MDSVKSSNSIPVIAPNIRKPTMISAGAVAKAGMARNKGDKKRETRKKKATNMAVNPVLPPSLTPVALSTKVVTVLVPRTAPAVVATASAIRAPLI